MRLNVSPLLHIIPKQNARRSPSVMQSLAVLGAWLMLTVPQTSVLGQTGVESGDWRFYGGDAGSTRYSALDLIDRDNVQNLQIAWRWKA